MHFSKYLPDTNSNGLTGSRWEDKCHLVFIGSKILLLCLDLFPSLTCGYIVLLQWSAHVF